MQIISTHSRLLHSLRRLPLALLLLACVLLSPLAQGNPPPAAAEKKRKRYPFQPHFFHLSGSAGARSG